MYLASRGVIRHVSLSDTIEVTEMGCGKLMFQEGTRHFLEQLVQVCDICFKDCKISVEMIIMFV